jgi:hypothetical protein
MASPAAVRTMPTSFIVSRSLGSSPRLFCAVA